MSLCENILLQFCLS